ncbi:hypothetical protein ACEQPO_28315 [Bacillus sp. SL00103]
MDQKMVDRTKLYFNNWCIYDGKVDHHLCYNIYYSWRHAKREVSGTAGEKDVLLTGRHLLQFRRIITAALPEVTAPDAFIIGSKTVTDVHPEKEFKKIHMRTIQSGRLSCLHSSDLGAFGLGSWNGTGLVWLNRCIHQQ